MNHKVKWYAWSVKYWMRHLGPTLLGGTLLFWGVLTMWAVLFESLGLGLDWSLGIIETYDPRRTIEKPAWNE